MGHCSMCRRLPHCPLPAQREELSYDFLACAFYERLSPEEWSRKLGKEWAQRSESDEYFQVSHWNKRDVVSEGVLDGQ